MLNHTQRRELGVGFYIKTFLTSFICHVYPTFSSVRQATLIQTFKPKNEFRQHNLGHDIFTSQNHWVCLP